MLCIPTSRKPVTLDTPVLNTIQKSTPARDRMKMLSSLLAECEIIFASSRPSASQAYHCWTILNGVTEVDECNSKNTEYYTLSSLNFLLPTLYPSSLTPTQYLCSSIWFQSSTVPKPHQIPHSQTTHVSTYCIDYLVIFCTNYLYSTPYLKERGML